MRRAIDGAGYMEVKTPQVMDARQWEQSGHWGKYRENMFVVPDEVPNTEDEGPVFGRGRLDGAEADELPGACPDLPSGDQILSRLPLRMATKWLLSPQRTAWCAARASCASASSRRTMPISFCREDQIVEEVQLFCDLLDSVYKDLGFENYAIKLALRPEKRFGTDEDVGQGRS
jgi:threonyl-tRNA synthetase